jgi:hypothetical protein
VDDAALVGEPEPVGDLVGDIQLPDRRERRVVADQDSQGVAIDVLHGDVQLPVVVAHVVDRDDVGVLEPAGRLSFTNEAAAQVLAVDAEQLQGDVPVDDGVAGEVEHTHPALAEEAIHFESTDDRGHVAHERS